MNFQLTAVILVGISQIPQYRGLNIALGQRHGHRRGDDAGARRRLPPGADALARRCRARALAVVIPIVWVQLEFEGGGRLTLAGLGIATLVAWSLVRPRRAQKIAVVLAIPLFLIFSGLNRLEKDGQRNSGSSGVLTSGDGLSSMYGPLDTWTELVQLTPEEQTHSRSASVGPRYGKTFLNTLLLPIPRSMWEDKPKGFGAELTEILRAKLLREDRIAPEHSMAALINGEFYVNFGIPGLVLLPFAVGWFLAGAGPLPRPGVGPGPADGRRLVPRHDPGVPREQSRRPVLGGHLHLHVAGGARGGGRVDRLSAHHPADPGAVPPGAVGVHVLERGAWVTGFLDATPIDGTVRITVHRQVALAPADDQYFVRPPWISMPASYLRMLGPRRVVRKVVSRRSEATRNDSWLTVGVGLTEAGAAVGFVAPAGPRAAERTVVAAALCFPVGQGAVAGPVVHFEPSASAVRWSASGRGPCGRAASPGRVARRGGGRCGGRSGSSGRDRAARRLAAAEALPRLAGSPGREPRRRTADRRRIRHERRGPLPLLRLRPVRQDPGAAQPGIARVAGLRPRDRPAPDRPRRPGVADLVGHIGSAAPR